MAVNSNSAGGTLRLSAGLPAGPWTFSGFLRIAGAVGGGFFQGLGGFDNSTVGGNELGWYMWEPGGTRLRWHARSGGVDNLGDVFNVLAGNQVYYFLSSRWAGGANLIEFAWRRINVSTLTSVSSTRTGFNPSQFEIFTDFLFGPAFDVDFMSAKIWNASLSNEELLRESYQFAPARWANIVSWYPTVAPATVVTSNNGFTALTLGGAVISAASPNIAPSSAAIFAGM